MKQLLAAFLLFFSTGLYAQTTFSVQHDTVYANPPVGSGITVEDGVSAVTDTVVIVWKVVASDFPPDWITANAICDNRACTFLPTLWSATAGTLAVKTSNAYGVAHLDTPGGDFHMLIGFSDTNTTGCHYLTVRMNNQLLPPDTARETYIICNHPLGTPTVARYSDDIILYPNPAHDQVKLICNTSLAITTVTVYDIVGNAMISYPLAASNTASFNIKDLPSGIYFVKLADATGKIVATKKLAKQ